jgi:hypothetical protein
MSVAHTDDDNNPLVPNNNRLNAEPTHHERLIAYPRRYALFQWAAT